MTKNDSSSTHPPLPPTTEDHRIDRLRLLRSRRVGPATYRRMMAEHGSAQAALHALPEIARDAGLAKYEPCPEGVVRAEIKAAKAMGARAVFEGEPDYPAGLSDLTDAPVMLWMIGDTTLLHRPSIALVGARNASSLGTRMARKLAQDLGEAGFVVVSGLARGIDAVAHDTALDTGTIAVMAGGLMSFIQMKTQSLPARLANRASGSAIRRSVWRPRPGTLSRATGSFPGSAARPLSWKRPQNPAADHRAWRA